MSAQRQLFPSPPQEFLLWSKGDPPNKNYRLFPLGMSPVQYTNMIRKGKRKNKSERTKLPELPPFSPISLSPPPSSSQLPPPLPLQQPYTSQFLNELTTLNCELEDMKTKYSFFNLYEELIGKHFLQYYPVCFTRKISIEVDIPLKKVISSNLHHHINNRCHDYKIEIYPISRRDFYGSGHRTYVIVNKFTQEIDYYEPHGNPDWHSTIKRFILAEFKKVYPNFKYVVDADVCPAAGPQNLVKRPWCEAFSLLYVIVRIQNYTKTAKEVVDDMMKNGRFGIFTTVSKFICYTFETIRNRYPETDVDFQLDMIGRTMSEIQTKLETSWDVNKISDVGTKLNQILSEL